MEAITTCRSTAAGPLTPVLALVAALMMMFALVVPAGPAFADHGEPRGTGNVCPPPGEAEPGESQFGDTEGHAHQDNIECLAAYEIAQGYEDGTYRPDVAINRAQMATYVRNFVETALGQPLAQPAAPQFTDVQGNTHQDNIEAVAEAGIVNGYPEQRYRPERNVNRAQMATFVANAIDYVDDREVNGTEPPATEQSFFNDTDETVHADNIARLAAQHIVVGTGNDAYSPDRVVRRGAMATFVMQGADYLAAQDLWLIGPAEMTLDPAEAQNPANLRHRVTATVTDDVGFAFAGAEVRFEAYREQGSTEQGTFALELVADGHDVTDFDGEAFFTYNAGATEGDRDRIIACVLEEGDEPAEGDEFCGERQFGQNNTLIGITPREDRVTAEATKDWTAEAQPQQAQSGEYLGEAIAIDAAANDLDVQTFDEEFLRFAYAQEDTFHVNDNQDVTEEQFECAVQATVDEEADHFIGIDYDTEAASEFGLFTDAEVGPCFAEGGASA